MITLNVSPEHAVAIINLLGETPTKNGAWELYSALIAQVQAQTTKKEVPSGDISDKA